jgi:hypothetical protein
MCPPREIDQADASLGRGGGCSDSLVPTAAPENRAAQFTMSPPAQGWFANPYGSAAVSPDGRLMVFSVGRDDPAGNVLWLRSMDSPLPRALP